MYSIIKFRGENHDYDNHRQFLVSISDIVNYVIVIVLCVHIPGLQCGSKITTQNSSSSADFIFLL